MKAIDFVTEAKDANHKPSVIEEHCKTEYISCLKKVEVCNRIARQALFNQNDNGVNYYSPNRALFDILLDIEIVRNYTDIEIDSIEDYDLLCSERLIKPLKAQIPHEELETFTRIANQCAEDVREKENNITSLIRNLIFSDKLVSAVSSTLANQSAVAT